MVKKVEVICGTSIKGKNTMEMLVFILYCVLSYWAVGQTIYAMMYLIGQLRLILRFDIRTDKFFGSKHLFTQRTINDKVYELPFEAESDGTKKMIAALPVLMVALQEGRTVVVDELDAKLHPKLLRYVIQMFKNPELNKKGAQLLFSSHDLTTMKNTVFRRDEIWFAAMNDNHESEIYSLYEFRQEDNTRVKSTAAFDKQYLEGRYGADQCVSVFEGSGKW